MNLASFIGGLAVGFVVGLFSTFIIYAWLSGDRVEQFADDTSEIHGAGGADFFQHASGDTDV